MERCLIWTFNYCPSDHFQGGPELRAEGFLHLESKHTAHNNPPLISAHQEHFLCKWRPGILVRLSTGVIFVPNNSRQDFWGRARSQMCTPLFKRLETWLSAPWVGLPRLVSALILSRLLSGRPSYHCRVWPSALEPPSLLSVPAKSPPSS